MTYMTTKNRMRIREVIGSLHSSRGPITVQIEGEKDSFASRIIKVDYDDTPLKSGKRGSVILEGLSPEKGNALMKSANRLRVSFYIGKLEYQFISHLVARSTESPYFGYIITYPEALMIIDRRKDDRYGIGTEIAPLFANARVTLRQMANESKSYDLKVLDISKNGVGLLVEKDQDDVFEKVGFGDKLEELELYATWTAAKVSGTVKHRSKRTEGEYSGHYHIGIQLDESLESYVA